MHPLLPDRHPNGDLFICDFGDVMPKSDIASMEHPLFTLSTKPDTQTRHYEHNGNSVKIIPSTVGHATVHDKDILIYCISQLMQGVNQAIDEAKAAGKEKYLAPSRKIRFKAHDLLIKTNRQVNGQGYELLKKALTRLRGTVIETNIITGKQEKWSVFGILDTAEVVRKMNGRMTDIEVTLSEWLYNAILGQEVLSINPEYFKLRKPLERRLYEIARKHCGKQRQWKIGLDKLHKKCGSSGTKEKFKHMINRIVKHDDLPDYSVVIEANNVVVFYNKNPFEKPKTADNRPFLKPSTIENAKKILRPYGIDVYALEAEWIQWWKDSGEPKLATPDGAFINFSKKRVGRIRE